MTVQEQRAAIDLRASLLDPHVRALVVAMFERQLTDYLAQLINPSLGDGEALAIRLKAMGVMESMATIAESMRSVEDLARRTATKAVKQTLVAGITWE